MAALALVLGAGSVSAALGPAVTVEGGRIAGETSGPVAVFRGIPYAAPPVGALRWRPPQRAAAWSGVRPATRFGPACPQAGGEGVTDIVRYGGAPEPTSEDCLTLNVWAPPGLSGRAPVMVWLHGGSGRMGAGSLPYYDGTAFARDGVVLVTVNYRLGHLGAFDHPAITREAGGKRAIGAYAQMDQVAALQWVRRNIASFGGDPGRVTIFGESAGSFSVNLLMASPLAKGLFQR
ncbi:MAG TPA: carboxylesterase family protein, partial [Phenylobacterium sp.]|nr:carboxylesterase family protein [Phenylobacterium sp.]